MKESTTKDQVVAHTSGAGQSGCHAALAAAMCIAAIFGNATTASAAAIMFKKSPVKLIDTGLENTERSGGPSQAAVWVNDHSLVAGVSLEKSAHDPYKIGRTVLYDLNTGKTLELMRYAHPLCWDAKTGQAGIAAYPNPENPKIWRTLTLQVNENGDILRQREVSAFGWDSLSCDMTPKPRPGASIRVFVPLRPEHGYIDLGLSGKPRGTSAVLIHPDGKKTELSMDGRQIGRVRYLDFLGKYQLDFGGGCSVQGEKCPPDIHIMDPSGEVTAITIPLEVMEIMPIQRVHVVRNGLLFRAESRDKREGYFLFRDGALHDLWRPGSPGLMSPQRTETWGGEAISPNGCMVAFRRGVWPRRTFVFDHCAIGI
jgi:hypothetical protein